MNKWLIALTFVALAGIGCGKVDETDPVQEFSGTTQTQATSNDLTNRTLADVTAVTFDKGQASISLSENDSSTHLLIISAAETLTSGSYPLQLASLGVAGLRLEDEFEDPETPSDPDEANFHQLLIESTGEMVESDDYEIIERELLHPSSLQTLAKKTDEEDKKTKTFKVLSSMTSLARYKEVKASLRAETTDLYFYVDEAAADHITDDQIKTLADRFQNIIIPVDRSLFGRESDINGDGHITILMSCVTNSMSSSGGIVTGFYFPGDQFAAATSNPASNEQEIFYTIVPDPQGKCGVPISADFALNNILPGVLAHEYQHMISFNQHVLVSKGKTEEPWLNEALSHFAEDLTGFGLENHSRFKLFLDHPNTTALIPPTSPNLAERGAGFSFLRYLYEQHPSGANFLRNLLKGDKTGVKNLIAAFGNGDASFDELEEFIQGWSIALALTDTGITDDPRMTFRPRSTDSNTGNPTGLCLRCEAKDGRGTILNGPAMTSADAFPFQTSVIATGSQFILFSSAPAGLAIQSAGSPTLTGSMLRLE